MASTHSVTSVLSVLKHVIRVRLLSPPSNVSAVRKKLFSFQIFCSKTFSMKIVYKIFDPYLEGLEGYFYIAINILSDI